MDIINNLSELELNTELDFSKYENKKEAHWSRDKNIRDILIHLYEWHQLIINHIQKNISGEKHDFFPKPYTLKTTPEMNMMFWEKHQNTSYDEALKMIDKSHYKVMKIIESFSDEQLFTKKYYNWTGTTSLGSYLISATSSHYDWAIKKIKAHKKNCK